MVLDSVFGRNYSKKNPKILSITSFNSFSFYICYLFLMLATHKIVNMRSTEGWVASWA